MASKKGAAQSKLATFCWIMSSVMFGLWQRNVWAGILWFFSYLLILATAASIMAWEDDEEDPK